MEASSARQRRFARIACVAVLVAACAEQRDPVAELRIRRDTVADTVFVRAESGSVWGSSATVMEDLRIGVVDGPDEYIFGDVVALAPDRQGGLYAFDRQIPALRQYDSAGRYVRTLGRRGSGPGEYQSVTGVVAAEDGRVLTHDPGLRRITVYGSDGTPLRHWPVPSGLFDGNSLALDSSGNVFVKIITER